MNHNTMMHTVVNNIKANQKRMEKIRSGNDRRNQAKKFVVAECQAIHFRATENEICQMAVKIAG